MKWYLSLFTDSVQVLLNTAKSYIIINILHNQLNSRKWDSKWICIPHFIKWSFEYFLVKDKYVYDINEFIWWSVLWRKSPNNLFFIPQTKYTYWIPSRLFFQYEQLNISIQNCLLFYIVYDYTHLALFYPNP